MNAQIIAHPKLNRTRIPCRGCGTLFIPARAHHRLCRDCFHWNRALHGIETARVALREVGR